MPRSKHIPFWCFLTVCDTPACPAGLPDCDYLDIFYKILLSIIKWQSITTCFRRPIQAPNSFSKEKSWGLCKNRIKIGHIAFKPISIEAALEIFFLYCTSSRRTRTICFAFPFHFSTSPTQQLFLFSFICRSWHLIFTMWLFRGFLFEQSDDWDVAQPPNAVIIFLWKYSSLIYLLMVLRWREINRKIMVLAKYSPYFRTLFVEKCQDK